MARDADNTENINNMPPARVLPRGLSYFALKNPRLVGDGRRPEREDGLDLLG